MKSTLITSLLAITATASALPSWGSSKGDNKPWSGSKGDHKSWGSPDVFTFTSTYKVHATPDQVVSTANEYTGGLPGTTATYLFGLAPAQNTICYNITLYNFRGDYQSPAISATHIHEAVKGKSGPPRIAFPNPVWGEGDMEGVRTSIGCIRGPFMTGVMAPAGGDTGAGFHVSQIEKNPAGFFSDVHSSLAVPGAVRGQLA
ncbi:hypothetical protein K402DRAFT_406533 [Aulographum hederae CBS 113979]|uniref:CHRD domain-containing protein n=1 Tax=Aulographum hederae CBS 113979 TaxID=1176131 RepID=A0A6G1GS47_9PEZI|nr:hypothetical protein K402DRAFT_406533 [Aulographum hederae CBS 113979]